MQENEFEKTIRDKMQSLELLPGAAVWEQVSSRISQRRKRRLFIYWLAASLLLLALAGGWWMMNKTTPVNMFGNAGTTPEKMPAAGLAKDTGKVMNYKVKSAPVSGSIKKKVKRSAMEEKYVGKAQPADKEQFQETSKPIVKATITRLEDTKATAVRPAIIKPASPVKPNLASTYKTRTIAEKPLPLHKFYHPEIDSALPASAATAAVKKDTAATSVATKKTVKNQSYKSWSIGFTAAAGVSDNISGLLPDNEKSYLSDQYSTIPVTSTSPPAIAALTYKPGFSFIFGIYASRGISKRTGISLGINYHYYSSASHVGTIVNSTSRLYDSSLNALYSSNSYYTQGQAFSYTNKYHLVQLPVLLEYAVNNNLQKPVTISAGVVPGYLFSSAALYADHRQGVYHEEKKQLNHFQLSGSAGVMFTLASLKPLRLAAGPVVEYGFTNLTKAIAANSQHLFFTGVKANISLR